VSWCGTVAIFQRNQHYVHTLRDHLGT